MALDLNMDIDVTKKIVTLPKLPLVDYSLQKHDGGSVSSSKSHGGSATDCLCALAPYLSKTKKAALLQLLSEPQHLTIKYRNVNFKCRIFKKYSGSHTLRTSATIGNATSDVVEKEAISVSNEGATI